VPINSKKNNIFTAAALRLCCVRLDQQKGGGWRQRLITLSRQLFPRRRAYNLFTPALFFPHAPNYPGKRLGWLFSLSLFTTAADPRVSKRGNHARRLTVTPRQLSRPLSFYCCHSSPTTLKKLCAAHATTAYPVDACVLQRALNCLFAHSPDRPPRDAWNYSARTRSPLRKNATRVHCRLCEDAFYYTHTPTLNQIRMRIILRHVPETGWI
jgi:hypothetical protein